MATYISSEQKIAPTCGLCGRRLGVGFYFSCHICGATFCYAHSPEKCTHAKARPPALKVQLQR